MKEVIGESWFSGLQCYIGTGKLLVQTPSGARPTLVTQSCPFWHSWWLSGQNFTKHSD